MQVLEKCPLGMCVSVTTVVEVCVSYVVCCDLFDLHPFSISFPSGI